MAGLVGRFGDDDLDAAAAELLSVASGAVGLVAQQRVRGRPWTARAPGRDPELTEQLAQRRGVVGLPRSAGQNERTSLPVDDCVGLGRQTTAGPADPVVVRFARFVQSISRILVIR